MLDLASKHVRNCRARAAACRQRADAAADDNVRAFWRAEEARWLKLAADEDLSTPMPGFLDGDPQGFSPEAEDGVATLVRVFNRACRMLNLGLSDETLQRKIARTIILAAIDGESDPEVLLQRALRVASN